jgi:hypothetical protein
MQCALHVEPWLRAAQPVPKSGGLVPPLVSNIEAVVGDIYAVIITERLGFSPPQSVLIACFWNL